MKNNGIFLAFLTAVISGFSIFFSKLFISSIDPLFYTVIKNGIVAFVLTGLIVLSNNNKVDIKNLSRKDWLSLFSIGLIGGSIAFALFFIGLSKTTSLSGSLIHKTLFIWVTLLALFFLSEKITIKQGIGYAIVLLGAFWLSGFKSVRFGTGEIMILCATVFWAVEQIIAKKTLSHISYKIVAWGRMFFGSLILLVIYALFGKTQTTAILTTQNILAATIGSLFLLGYVLTWYKALSKAPATVVSSVLVLSTVITAGLTSIIINKSLPTLPELSVIFLTIFGVLIITFFSLHNSSKSLVDKRS